jgi:DNA topoisomerase-1
VQSVAVRLVVDREREIEAFKPEEYWSITTTLAKPKTLSDKFVAKYVNKVTDGKKAKKIKADLDGDTFKILSVDKKEKKKNPKPPFITSSLAGAAAGKFRFPVSKTAKLSQTLYEAGLITYIRTDSFRISPEAVKECRAWLKKNKHDIPTKPNMYLTKKAAQDAHECIRPTEIDKTPEKVYLSGDEKKLYQMIWERFVASQMNPAVYDTMAVTVESSSRHKLKANGRALKYKGWLDICEDFDEKDGDLILPPLKAGDDVVLVPPKVKVEQKFTQPPPRFSERTLVKELEKQGIGRPSTFANIMSKITHRNYVEKKSSAFVPTDLGKSVVDALVNNFAFMEYKYTSDMEKKLDDIAEGSLKYKDMLASFYDPFKKELKRAVLSENKDYGFKCKNCSEPMVLKHGRFGFYLACYDYPTCKSTLSCRVIDGKPVLSKGKFEKKVEAGIECPNCGAGMIKKDGKFGLFYACSKYPKCKGTRKVPFGKKCPDCNDELYATVYQGKSILFCMGYPNCRHSEKLPRGSVADPNVICKGQNLPKNIKKVLK